MRKKLLAVSRRLARPSHGSEIAEFAMARAPPVPAPDRDLLGGAGVQNLRGHDQCGPRRARAAVNPACTTCAGVDPTQNAWTVIQNDLQAAHINPNALQQPTNPPAVCACSNGTATGCSSTTVACDNSQNKICVQGVTHSGTGTVNWSDSYVRLSSTIAPSKTQAGGAGECGISVSFQYPYTFWLPGSSLNNETINLRAQAQMRAESQ